MSAVGLLADECLERYPDEAARVLERLEPERAAALFEELAPDRAAALLGKLGPGFAASALEAASPERAAAAVARLHPNAAAHILQRCQQAAAVEILQRVGAGFARQVRGLLARPPGCAGSLADAGALALPEDLTAADALREIRRHPEALVHYLYVLDRDGRLVGAIDPVALLVAEPGAPLDDLARRKVPRLAADESSSAVAYHPAWSDWEAVAVIDKDGRFAGALGFTVAIRLRREQADQEPGAVDFGLSLAELFWLGLAGVTEGIARVVERRRPDG